MERASAPTALHLVAGSGSGCEPPLSSCELRLPMLTLSDTDFLLALFGWWVGDHSCQSQRVTSIQVTSRRPFLSITASHVNSGDESATIPVNHSESRQFRWRVGNHSCQSQRVTSIQVTSRRPFLSITVTSIQVTSRRPFLSITASHVNSGDESATIPVNHSESRQFRWQVGDHSCQSWSHVNSDKTASRYDDSQFELSVVAIHTSSIHSGRWLCSLSIHFVNFTVRSTSAISR